MEWVETSRSGGVDVTKAPYSRRAGPIVEAFGRAQEESMKLTDIADPNYFHKVVDCQ